MYRSYEEHEALFASLTPLHASTGRSSSIFFDPKERAVFKVQYLIAAPTRKGTEFFSVQVFEPRLLKHRESVLDFFHTGQLAVPEGDDPEAHLRWLTSRLMANCTHSFLEEIKCLEIASDAGITPPLREWYVCRTGNGLALGVYAQDMAEKTLEAMRPHELVECLHRCGSAPFLDLIKQCARAGLAHLDLIPSNIVMTRGKPQLIDFGLCVRAEKDADKTLTFALFFDTMLKNFAKNCHVSAHNTVYICGSLVPVTSVDYHLLLIHFFPDIHQRRAAAADDLKAVCKAVCKAGETPKAKTTSDIFSQAQKALFGIAGSKGENLFFVDDNTVLCNSE